MEPLSRQTLQNQQGEVLFRRKVVKQQIEGEKLLDDEIDAAEIERILRERMSRTQNSLSWMAEHDGVTLSPYLELGAERCQRCLTMENDLNARGAAADLSFDMLSSCAHYRKVFGKQRMPLRVCCDANLLPFRSGSLAFTFAYGTLHHFPDPTPIIAQLHRVLCPGGFFFFDEEPYKKVLHFGLMRGRKIHSRWFRKLGKWGWALHDTFTIKSCNEIDHGIVENEAIPLGTWRRALNIFDEVRAGMHTIKNIHLDLYRPGRGLKYLLAWLYGGQVWGLCRKAGKFVQPSEDVSSALICPECLAKGVEAGLAASENALTCVECSQRYPVADGVALLMTHRQIEQLYPEHLAAR